MGAGVVACSAGVGENDRVFARGTTSEHVQTVTIQQALRFGGIVLPPSAKVLGARDENGQDQLYVLAIVLEPDEIDVLLSDSGFTARLRAGERVFMQPVEGFELGSGTDVASGDDRLPAGRERAHGVNRTVLVDRSDPTAPVVHLWLFTT